MKRFASFLAILAAAGLLVSLCAAWRHGEPADKNFTAHEYGFPAQVIRTGLYSLRYRYDGTMKAENPLLGATGSEHHSAVALDGEVNFAAAEGPCPTAPNDCLVMTITPEKFAYVVNGTIEGTVITAALARPVTFSLSAPGAVTSIWFEPDVSAGAEALLRDILARTQLVLDDNVGVTTHWKTQEQDPIGNYAAIYAAESDPSGEVTIRKNVENHDAAFVQWDSPEGSQVAASGGATVHLDPKGHLREYVARQTFEVTLDAASRGSWTLDVSLTRRTDRRPKTAGGPARAIVTTPARRAEADDLSGTRARRDAERQLQIDALGRDTSDEVFARLDELDRGGRDAPSVQKRDAVLKLYALLFVHPELSDRFAETMLAHDPNSATASYLAGALAQTGHAEAQAALNQAANDCRGDERKLLQVVTALALVASPLGETTATLTALSAARGDADVVAGAATLGLGAVASHLAGRDPNESLRILQLLSGRLANATTSDERQLLLGALGNAGAHADSAVLFAAIHPWVHGLDGSVRVAAARALRAVPGEASDMALLAVLQSDSDSRVRYEAAKSLGKRHLDRTASATTIKRLAAENAPLVRGELIRGLWAARQINPSARDAVLAAASSDPSFEVRGIALTLVASAVE